MTDAERAAKEAGLTPAQRRMFEAVKAGRPVYAYNGHSAATARVLAGLGLVHVEWSVSERYVYRTRRTRYIRDWVATLPGEHVPRVSVKAA